MLLCMCATCNIIVADPTYVLAMWIVDISMTNGALIHSVGRKRDTNNSVIYKMDIVTE